MAKLILVGLPLAGGIDAVESAAVLARAVRATYRQLTANDIIRFPLVNGGRGTMDALVSLTLGSYLEVEATNAYGKQEIVPIGFCGEDQHIGIIETSRIAGVNHAGESGTTIGIGELLQDVLDERAHSIMLCEDGPIAFDAGLGLASALGVAFYDQAGKRLDMAVPTADLNAIDRIDVSGRSFDALAARILLAEHPGRAKWDRNNHEANALLDKLATLVERDIGKKLDLGSLPISASAIEFGLSAFFSTSVQDGSELVVEASGIATMLDAPMPETRTIILADSTSQLNEFAPAIQTLLAQATPGELVVVSRTAVKEGAAELLPTARMLSLEGDVKLFQQPLQSDAPPQTVMRDVTMRLEKLLPQLTIVEA